MQMNFFTWLRHGVRQAVLLGVADAVEEIGPPADKDKFQDQLTKAIDSGLPAARLPGKSKTTARKRLGRSLQDAES